MADVTFGTSHAVEGQGATAAIAHTIAEADPLLIVVIASVNLGGDDPIVTVTDGGVAMVEVGITQGAGASGLSVFRRTAPPAGVNNVLVSFGGVVCNYEVFALSYANANQSVPIRIATIAAHSNSGTGAGGAVLGTLAGNMVVDALVVDEVAATVLAAPHGGQIERAQDDTGAAGFKVRGAVSDEIGGGDVDMAWTLDASKQWAHKAFEILSADDVVIGTTNVELPQLRYPAEAGAIQTAAQLGRARSPIEAPTRSTAVNIRASEWPETAD